MDFVKIDGKWFLRTRGKRAGQTPARPERLEPANMPERAILRLVGLTPKPEPRIGKAQRLRNAARQIGLDLVTTDAIMQAAQPKVAPLCGIYFLISTDRIVYVGQSVNVLVRLAQHAALSPGEWDRWTWVEVEREHLDLVERAYIEALDPPYNCDQATNIWRKRSVASQVTA